MSTEYDAVVIGSGPNGLAAAVEIAGAGHTVLVVEAADQIGGGTRSSELTVPGHIHDVCSAIHPLGAGSPFLGSLPLREHGLEWVHAGVPLAHPFDDQPAGVLHRSLEDTAAALGTDANRYRRLMAPLVDRWDRVAGAALSPVLRFPRHPVTLARFGLRAMRSATGLAGRFRTDAARALIAGNGVHAIARLDQPFTGAVGLVLMAAGHRVGWPMALGGSRAITDALASLLVSLGGSIETGRPIATLGNLPPARAVLFATSPSAMERIAGDRLPARYRRALLRYRHGPGVFKVDWALSEPIPWTDPSCRRAGTVHVGGVMEEIAAAEADVLGGRHPERPFVLLAQQTLFDPSRAPAGRHTAWAYCHVPARSETDQTAAIEAQVERFAPGFRDTIAARHVMGPAAFEAHNPNLIGGDIGGGSFGLRQLVARPALRLDPYRTPAGDLYLCSSSTPPGAGVHGMCGFHAARSALRTSLR